jgi:signal peptide peptidase SppA
MSPHQYLSKIISAPLALDRVRGRTIIRSLAASLLKNERPAEDIFGVTLPKIQILGDIAIIPILGVIDLAVPDWIKGCGFGITDANDIEEEIAQALVDPNVRFLVFTVNSPGGSSLASEKLFDLVAAANQTKPCFAFVADGEWACSGGYYAIAACRDIYSGPYAGAIGNIGTWLSLIDDTEFWAQMGIKFDVFRSGEYKGIGEDPLSDEQRVYLQQITDRSGALFRKSVSKYRPGIAADDMRGQWFTGREAAAHGFLGGNVNGLNAAIVKFRPMV